MKGSESTTTARSDGGASDSDNKGQLSQKRSVSRIRDASAGWREEYAFVGVQTPDGGQVE